LIKEGLKEAKCECCGRTEWLGVPLELHHINEVHTDNRLENLLILCPNCHAMTDSHLNVEKLSALVEKQEVEGRKVREALIARFKKVTGNPEPSLNKEGAETKHAQPKSKKKTEPKYCSQECAHKANGSKRPDVFYFTRRF
jgi:hypothetical protein